MILDQVQLNNHNVYTRTVALSLLIERVLVGKGQIVPNANQSCQAYRSAMLILVMHTSEAWQSLS
jgi:hypothetical protein